MTNLIKTFKEAAIEILQKARDEDNIKSLHYREITKRAIKKGLIKSYGETPWATMGVIIRKDIEDLGEKSYFYKAQNPGFYGHKEPGSHVVAVKGAIVKINNKKKIGYQLKEELRFGISTRRKGDIIENRVSELITLYGGEGLNCYKPTTYDEGIDFIVKSIFSHKTIFIQVKSRFCYGKEDSLVVVVKKDKLPVANNSLIVFIYFDLVEGDIHDFIFCIPVDEFIDLTNSSNEKEKRVFSVSMKHPERSKFSQFMIEKRELAKTIAVYLGIFDKNN